MMIVVVFEGIYIMQAVRAIVQTSSGKCWLKVPEWAIGRKLEVIMLPSPDDEQGEEQCTSESLIDQLLEKPLKLSSFAPLSRESIYAR